MQIFGDPAKNPRAPSFSSIFSDASYIVTERTVAIGDWMKRIAAALTALIAAGICFVLYWMFPDSNFDNSGEMLSSSPASLAFSEFTEDLFVQWVQSDVLTLHYKLSDPSHYGIAPSEISLGNASPSAIRQQYAQLTESFHHLGTIEYRDLSSSEQFSYDVLEQFLSSRIQQEPFLLYDEPLGPTLGIQAQLPILLSEYAFQEENDIQNYLLLLDTIDTYFLSLLDFEVQKKEAGLFMEDSCLEQIRTQCLSFCETEEGHLLIASFQERMQNLPFSLSSEARQEYEARNERLVLDVVLPAYAMLADGLAQLEGSCLYPGGLCKKPDGQTYYSLLVHEKTGSSKSVPQLFEQTQQRLAENWIAIASLCEDDSTLLDLLSDYSFSLSDPEEILCYLKTEMENDFPPAVTGSCTVKYVPDSLSPFTSPAFYLIPPIDESSRNIIYLNNGSGLEAGRLFPVLAHEGYPGHLYQNTWFSDVNRYPIRALLSYPGYTEGWATYCEFYAYQLEPSFSRELASLLVEIQETTLGLYSLMDMGVHYYGWTAKDVFQTLVTYFGISEEDTALSVYHSLLESPANYLSYYIGYEEIVELRNYASQMWGDSFSLYRFHKLLLDLGPAPFSLIRDQI